MLLISPVQHDSKGLQYSFVDMPVITIFSERTGSVPRSDVSEFVVDGCIPLEYKYFTEYLYSAL